MSRYRIELCHKISVLHSWAMNPDKDTISSLSEDNARKACIHLVPGTGNTRLVKGSYSVNHVNQKTETSL